MKDLELPFAKEIIDRVIGEYGSPVYVYDEAGMRQTARDMREAFAWADGYKNYFAVKATPTPAILKALHQEGMGFDCSSRAELLMVQRMGISGEDIFYTSNNTPREDFELAVEMGATINIDDLVQVPVFTDVLGGREYPCVAARYNPGSLKSGNDIIGEPTEAKYGMTLEQLVEAFKQLKTQNIREFGLHTMVVSNERDPGYFADTARLLLDAVDRIEAEAGITIGFINLGGGFGLNYHPEQAPFDMRRAADEIREIMQARGKHIRLCTENGRFVTGPHGYLLTKVRYVMRKHKMYIGVDASMHNLMRPGMYGAYHHITVVGKHSGHDDHDYDVVGSLCENNDKFAIDRPLPGVEPGDVLVIHDVGAHGHAMGFNYNGLLKSPEIMLHADGTTSLIRRGETVDDLFATIVWE